MQQQPPQPPPAKLSPNAITTEQIQKCLEENKILIMAIMEFQTLGRFQECAKYQAVLQKNLMYLAAIADAQPPTSQIPNPSQVMQTPQNCIPQQPNSFMQQPQQPGGVGGGNGSCQKPPFQLNSLQTQDQQQLLHFQHAQMGQFRPAVQNGLFKMQPSMAANTGGSQGGSEAALGGGGGGDNRGMLRGFRDS